MSVFVVSTLVIALGSLSIASVQDAGATTAGKAPVSVTIHTSCGGSISILRQPAKGFDPLTASALQLSSLGYPQRPASSDEKALAAWVTAMKDAKQFFTPKVTCLPGRTNTNQCPARVTGSTTLPCQYYSDNWGGHVVAWTGYDNSQAPSGWNGIDYSAADWTVPNPGSYDNPYSFSSWTGIGIDPIIQAGVTQDDINGNGDPYFWFEDFSSACVSQYPDDQCPVTPYEQQAGPPIAKGQVAYVALDYEGNVDGQLDSIFWIENENTGQYSYFQTWTPYYDKSSAEWIVENHLGELDGYAPYIPPMSVPFSEAIYNGPGGTTQDLTSNNNISYICKDTEDDRGITPTSATAGSFTANSASLHSPCP